MYSLLISRPFLNNPGRHQNHQRSQLKISINYSVSIKRSVYEVRGDINTIYRQRLNTMILIPITTLLKQINSRKHRLEKLAEKEQV